MELDIKRVNIIEKDIEDWLWENPDEVRTPWGPVFQWLDRQLNVPSGTLDLLGIVDSLDLVVVEVKNVPITAAALTQVRRYAADIEQVLYQIEDKHGPLGDKSIHCLIIAPGDVDNQLQYEANALGVAIISFQLNLELELGGHWRFNSEYRKRLVERYKQMTELPAFFSLVSTAKRNSELWQMSDEMQSEDEEVSENVTTQTD